MRGPQGKRGHPHVHVAAGARGPLTHHVDGEADGFSRHGLNGDAGALLQADAVVEDGETT